MRNSPFWWILIAVMVLLDIYVFQAVKVIAHPASARIKTIIYISYWIVSVAALIVLLILPYLQFAHQAGGHFHAEIFGDAVGDFVE